MYFSILTLTYTRRWTTNERLSFVTSLAWKYFLILFAWEHFLLFLLFAKSPISFSSKFHFLLISYHLKQRVRWCEQLCHITNFWSAHLFWCRERRDCLHLFCFQMAWSYVVVPCAYHGLNLLGHDPLSCEFADCL